METKNKNNASVKKNLRVIDVNFNRAKEGLRVVEDIFRFIIEDNILRQHSRRIRHKLDQIVKSRIFKIAVLNRLSDQDIGRKIDGQEIKKSNYEDLLYSNMQRVKESLRVLEEFFKIVDPQQTKIIKQIRFDSYNLEKRIFYKLNSYAKTVN
jgi:thiamine-phosphate pyrophosphorylase